MFSAVINLGAGCFCTSYARAKNDGSRRVVRPRRTSVGTVISAAYFTAISVYLTGVPNYVTTNGMEKGWQIRGHRFDDHLIDVVYNNHGLPTEATIAGLEEDRCTIQDWTTLLESLGIRVLNQPKGVTATNEEGFNIEGLKLDFVTAEDKVVEAITIYLPKFK